MSEPIHPIEPSAPHPPALVGQALTRVRQEPAMSIASAFVVGLILSIFPIGRIISFFAGIGLMLLRPVLLVLGVLKASEEISRRRK
jgi:hypothetical protein